MTRRGFLGSGAAAVAAFGGAGTASLPDLTVSEAALALRRGEATAEAYATALLDRCAAERGLGAFISLDRDAVLAAARAADRARAAGGALPPLHGVPLAIKDSINTRDAPTTGGSPALRGFRPAEDAPVVARLREAGAILLGKTNLQELSLGWTSDNAAFGAVRNPYDPSRIPGGSSGGTAAAVAARMAPAGLGEDTLGSIRVPAALCGICGLRPTTGRYPAAGIMPLSTSFDTPGPMARSVADLALLDQVLSGGAAGAGAPAVDLRQVRLGVDRAQYYAGCARDVIEVAEHALARLREAGATIVELDLPDMSAVQTEITFPIVAYEILDVLPGYLARYGTGVSPERLIEETSPDTRPAIAALLSRYREPRDPAPYRAALDRLTALQAAFRSAFETHGVAALLYPTVRATAPPIPPQPVSPAPDIEIEGRLVPAAEVIGRSIAPASTAGLPGLVLPAGLTAEGLPVGIELDAPAGADEALLSLALAIERILPPIPAPARA